MSSYAPTNWQDYPSLATAISAARLNNMESGIQAAYRVGTGGLTNADIANGAAIAYSKLALTGQIVNADIAAAAAISYSKLQLAAAILNSDIANAAAIDLHKLNIPNDATKVALGDGTWGAPPAGGGTVGGQLDYAQITANVFTSTATEAAPLTVVQGNSVSYDGSPLIIDFCSSYVLLRRRDGCVMVWGGAARIVEQTCPSPSGHAFVTLKKVGASTLGPPAPARTPPLPQTRTANWCSPAHGVYTFFISAGK